MTTIRITENKEEMAQIGREIVDEKPEIYTERRVKIIKDKIEKMLPEATKEEKEMCYYCSVYDYWVYGNNIDEEFFLHFREMNHAEKCKYITDRVRFAYMRYLNAIEDVHILNNKYETYMYFKPYYGREIIEIQDDNDYDMFCEFVQKHKVFVVKPSDLASGVGVYKTKLDDFDSLRQMFDSILEEGRLNIKNNPWGQKSSVILEELIEQDVELSRFHPSSVNGLRITTVRVNNEVKLWYPEIKLGINGSFVDNGGQGAILAGVNTETGIIETDGVTEQCCSYAFHPNSNIKIKGYKIPRWDECISLVREMSDLLPSVKYIGWDLALTPKGWIVIEANSRGAFLQQMFYGKGLKEEFEDLIGWKPENTFWWNSPQYLHY